MNKLFTLSLVLLAAVSQAQPIIIDGSNVPSPGYSVPVSLGVPTSLGASGANQTWDFSAITWTPMGTYTIVDPSTTTMATSFPTANFAATLTPTAGSPLYFYFNNLSDKLENLASAIAATTDEHNYTPNPKTLVKFPFSFNESNTDVYQKVGFSPDNITNTYDGYGTLITSYGTYTNVVRIVTDYSGDDTTYSWYTLNPFMNVLAYDNNNNILYSFGVTQINSVSSTKSFSENVHIYPNPIADHGVIQIDDYDFSNNITLNIANTLGQSIKQIPVNSSVSEFNRDGITPGIYFYHLQSGKNIIATGKLIVE